MSKTILCSVCIAFCLVVVFVGGCGPENPLGRLAISGTVNFQGQPLDQGSIEFTSLEAQSGIRSGSVIQAGSFSIAAHQGLPPGKYRVRIYSSAQDPMAEVPEMPGMSDEVHEERIPAEYNTESKQEITVTSGGPNEFEFNIQ